MRLSLLSKIIDLCLPRFCPICSNRLSGEEECICMTCNLHLPRTDTWAQPADNEMAKLFWHRMPIVGSCALFYYTGHSPASNILYQLKYGNRPDLGVYMGHLLADEALRTQFFDDIDAIVAIPLAKNRKRERGYNQSEAIAQGLSEVSGLPIIKDIVKRKTFVESQTHKNRWERANNVEQIFELGEAYLPGSRKNKDMEGKHLLIVDDVCTTGATIISCCREIMKIEHVRFSVLTIGYAKG